MTQQPNVFSSHYYKELLAGGGAFASDRSLLSDPATAQWVRTCTDCLCRHVTLQCTCRAACLRIEDGDPQVQTYAADEALFFADFSAAYVKLGLLGATFR